MPDRALIIAIEEYDRAKGLASSSLPGLHEAAREFFNWITVIKGIPWQNIYICSDAPNDGPSHPIAGDLTSGLMPSVYGATRAEIRKAIFDLLEAGSGKTSDLFVYAAGHGFEYVDRFQQPGASILITAEYQDTRTGADACINLDELQFQLPTLLSGVCHFYFVDACRNRINSNINPVTLGLPSPSPGMREATQFTLYSARSGATASADKAFSDNLLGALEGEGHAKTRRQGKMVVTFLGVCTHLTEVLKKEVDKRIKGPELGQLYELKPPVTQKCTLTILGAQTTESYIATFASNGLSEAVHFTGGTCIHPLAPSDAGYQVDVTRGGQLLVQVNPAPGTFIDMYEDATLQFALPPPASPPEPPPRSKFALYPPGLDKLLAEHDISPPARRVSNLKRTALEVGGDLASLFPSSGKTAGVLHISLPVTEGWNDPSWSMLREDSDGVHPMGNDEPYILPAGLHTLHLYEDGVPVWKNIVRIQPGDVHTEAIGEPAPTTFQKDVMGLFDQQGTHCPEISELFGKTADWDINLWLAVIGTANIRPIAGYYQRLGLINIPNTPDLKKDNSGLLILVVCEGMAPEFAVHDGAPVQWNKLQPVSNVDSLFFVYTSMLPGPRFVSLKFAGKQPVTYATRGDAGVYTLFTAAATGTALSVQQLFVPALMENTAAWSPDKLTDLRLAKALSTAQRLHRDHQPLFECSFLPESVWAALTRHTWKNTQLLVLAAMDLRRRGRSEDLKALLATVQARDAMSDDLLALKATVNGTNRPEGCRPLLLDVLLLEPEYGDREGGPPMTHLNFNDMWVSSYASLSENEQVQEKKFYEPEGYMDFAG